MSKENEKEFIKEDISPSKSNEPATILHLVEEISKLEEKISNMKKLSSIEDNSNKINEEIKNLKKTKNNLNKEMNNLSLNLLLETSNKENLIKKKSYLIKDLIKKINNYKNILSTYNTLSFTSPILKKYILSNKMNQSLSDEQIDDIMSKTQTKYNNDNLIQKYEKEHINNKEELNNIENDKKKIIQKIEEIKENLKMIKEEKLTYKNELVNYISLKETLESIIKVNLPSLLILNNKEEKEDINDDKTDYNKNYDKNSFISKDNHSQHRANTINSITEEENDNENNNNNVEYIDMSFYNNNNLNIKSKKNWDEIINLYKYEFFYLDPNKISIGISDEIFDAISTKIINENNNYPFSNNFGNSILLETKKTPNILEKTSKPSGLINSINIINNRYSAGPNQMIFSCESPIIKKTRANIFLFNDINDCKKEVQVELKNEISNCITSVNNNNLSVEKLNEKIAEMIIYKLGEYSYFLNKKNLMIYLSCYFKKSYYECMISLKLKFINKDYKNIKKNRKKKIENFHDQLTKLNTKTETIKNTIILQENKIKMLNSIEDKDKNKDINEININNNIKHLKLTLDEQNYIQLCRKANSYINEKNEIEREIEEAENDKKLNKYQGEIKINSLKNEIKDIDKQINSIENESFSKKAKSDDEISKCRKLIIDKINMIKDYLEIFKNKCLNNDINIYNEFIDTISSNLKNKYYKSLLDLEKFNSLSIKNNPKQKIKNNANKSFNLNKEIISYTSFSNNNSNINSKTHRKTSSDVVKSFNYEEKFLSPINKNKKKNYIMFKDDNNKSNDYFNSTSKKKRAINNTDKSNRVKNNNYINVFDSCNNLNNYFFQFQTPSTIISIDENKKINNFLNKSNKNEINIVSYTTPFSSASKFSNSNKKKINTKREIKPTNLINNLKYCVSDKKVINTEVKNNSINKNNEFKININNIYESKNRNNKNQKIINNLLSSFSKEKNNYFNNSKSDYISNSIKNNSLFTKTFCYFKIINNDDSTNINENGNEKHYNPLEVNISLAQLCQQPYNYIKSTLSFDKKEDMIKINPTNQLDSINIKIDIIENSYINDDMKIIIDVFKGFIKYKNKYNNEDISRYIKELEKGDSIVDKNLDEEKIRKCCNNKNFSFNICIKNNLIIEFIFCSYEEFKLWNDAVSFFIKNNKQFQFNLSKLTKFEYP